MTEEVPDDVGGGRKRLLFLTNSQAELISGSSASLQKMLDALEIPRPKLVINLLVSQGSTDYVANEILGELADLAKSDAGLVPRRGPFAGPDEERQMIEMLDHFMETVILPLAAQTNAFILWQRMPEYVHALQLANANALRPPLNLGQRSTLHDPFLNGKYYKVISKPG